LTIVVNRRVREVLRHRADDLDISEATAARVALSEWAATTNRDKMAFLAGAKAAGYSDAEAFFQFTGRRLETGKPPDDAEIAEARGYAERLFGDPDMVVRLMRGDPFAIILLGVVMSRRRRAA
jgi:hypothetical protein